MLKTVRWAIGAGIFLTIVAVPSSALAAGEATGGGAGCQANGQAVAGAAQGPGAFGQIVKTQAPIADNVAEFKAAFCS